MTETVQRDLTEANLKDLIDEKDGLELAINDRVCKRIHAYISLILRYGSHIDEAKLKDIAKLHVGDLPKRVPNCVDSVKKLSYSAFEVECDDSGPAPFDMGIRHPMLFKSEEEFEAYLERLKSDLIKLNQQCMDEACLAQAQQAQRLKDMEMAELERLAEKNGFILTKPPTL